MLISFLRAKLRQFVRNESGATAIEYALIAGLIAVALVAILGTLATNLTGTFGLIGDALPQPAAGGGGG